jgi:uncharacterized protein
MDFVLDPVEVRILGCLMEKEMTTPEYYPLTLNALTAACNQKSNRDPILSLDDATVLAAVESLGAKELVWEVRLDGSRTSRYEHNIKTAFDLSVNEKALLCVLLLRGPQTSGELRARTSRMSKFDNPNAVEQTLAGLMESGQEPIVVQLPVRRGMKEPRYTHLLAGEPDPGDELEPTAEVREPIKIIYENPQITRIEERIASLETEMDDLKRRFTQFASQFE